MRRTGFSVLALLLLAAPQALAGQASESSAHASLEAFLVQTIVRDASATFAGGAGLLSLNGRFALGAAGALMLGAAPVESDGASDLDLRLAYGGLLLQMTLTGSRNQYVALRTLVGAGNARIELPVVGSEIAADNFGVVEPELVGMTTLAGPLQLGLGFAYRHLYGVDDLPNVAPDDLTGFSARVRLSIRTN